MCLSSQVQHVSEWRVPRGSKFWYVSSSTPANERPRARQALQWSMAQSLCVHWNGALAVRHAIQLGQVPRLANICALQRDGLTLLCKTCRKYPLHDVAAVAVRESATDDVSLVWQKMQRQRSTKVGGVYHKPFECCWLYIVSVFRDKMRDSYTTAKAAKFESFWVGKVDPLTFFEP